MINLKTQKLTINSNISEVNLKNSDSRKSLQIKTNIINSLTLSPRNTISTRSTSLRSPLLSPKRFNYIPKSPEPKNITITSSDINKQNLLIDVSASKEESIDDKRDLRVVSIAEPIIKTENNEISSLINQDRQKTVEFLEPAAKKDFDFKLPTGNLAVASIYLQSIFRKILALRRYKAIQNSKKSVSGYIAYGRKMMNGNLYFVTVSYIGFDKLQLRNIAGTMADKGEKINIILDAYPLKSGISKPKRYVCMSEKVKEILGIREFETMRTVLQQSLLSHVRIVDDELEFYNEVKPANPRKRLIFRGKNTLRTDKWFNLRIYEIYQGSGPEYLICAFNGKSKQEISLKVAEMNRILDIDREEKSSCKVHDLVKKLGIKDGKLIIKRRDLDEMIL